MIKISNTVLKKILIKTKRAVFSEIAGNNISSLKGEGYDFSELKEYEYGEDVKNIDWMISAKMQKPYSKVFHAQKELNISIVSIYGGSVHFGTHKLKQEVMTEVATILAYSCVKQGDPFESYIVNEDVSLSSKKTKTIFGVYSMAQKLLEYKSLNKKTNYQNITDNLYKKITKRSLLFLIGDFFDTSTLDLKLLNKKHEVVVIIIRDHFEEEPKQLGNVKLVDPSTNTKFEGSLNKSIINKYIAKIKHNDHLLFSNLQQNGIKFTKIYTNEDPISKIVGLINR